MKCADANLISFPAGVNTKIFPIFIFSWFNVASSEKKLTANLIAHGDSIKRCNKGFHFCPRTSHDIF